MLSEKLIELFWSKVDRKGDNDCWEWKGSLRHGYGQFPVRISGKPINLAAHRVAYELTYGPIPEGKLACHHCDNRRCVNPNHIFPGSYQDNMDDMKKKGKPHHRVGKKGETNWQAKLTQEQADWIRKNYQPKKWGFRRDLAKRLGVLPSLISSLMLGRTYQDEDVPSPIVTKHQ